MEDHRKKQLQIEELQHDLLLQDAMTSQMEYLKGNTESQIEKHTAWHENELKRARFEREKKVNHAIWYAAELKQRLEIMERVQQKQQAEFEKIKEAGDIVFAENIDLERAIARKKDELRVAKRAT